MKRILAIDYGAKRIGLAITDAGQILALPLTTVLAKKTHKESALAVQKNTLHYSIAEIVIGLPLLPNGKEGAMSREARLFGSAIEEVFSTTVHFFDERFTSLEAHRSLSNLSRKKRTKIIDPTSAVMLLRDFLQARSSG